MEKITIYCSILFLLLLADCDVDDISSENTDNNVENNYNNPGETYIPVSSSPQSKDKKVDVIGEVINNARRLVKFKDLCSKLSSFSQPIQNVMPSQPNFNILYFNEALKNILPLTITNSRQIFGFRIYTCRRCLEAPIEPVFYSYVRYV